MLQLRRPLTAVTRILLPADFSSYDSVENLPPQNPSYFGSERRSPRREFEMLLTATATDGAVYRGFCRDMSEGGTAALIWGELNIRDEVSLTYRLPESTEVAKIAAIVRHRVGFRYGLEFCVTDGLAGQSGPGKLFAMVNDGGSHAAAGILV
jgi:PilZ domain